MTLAALGHTAEVYLSADAFLEAVDLHQSAIAILDIQMPGMDGIELLSRIKSANSSISVIMLTGHGTISMPVQSIPKGAIDFLEKPVDGDKLNSLLVLAEQATFAAFDHHVLRLSISERLSSLTARELEVMQKMQVKNVAELAYLMAKIENSN